MSTFPRRDAILNSGLLFDGPNLLTPKWKSLSFTASADIVAAVSGKKIRVIAVAIVFGGSDHTLKWQSGASTDLTGVLEVVAAERQHVWPFNPCGWFETVAGEKLNAVTAGTTPTFEGVLQYVEV